MPSFDIVSQVDMQEVDNAVQQAAKEVKGRYDFRGSQSKYEWDKKQICMVADDDYKLKALKEILQSKLHRRGVDILALKYSDSEAVGHQMKKQVVDLVQGIEREMAKKICKAIKESKLKVQAQVQDDKIRVTSKSIDNLQACFAYVKKGNHGIPLQMENMRS